MLQFRACSLPPQSLPRTEPEFSSVAVSPPLRKPLVCHHERDRDHGLAERESTWYSMEEGQGHHATTLACARHFPPPSVHPPCRPRTAPRRRRLVPDGV